jgi:hypothetical protein
MLAITEFSTTLSTSYSYTELDDELSELPEESLEESLAGTEDESLLCEDTLDEAGGGGVGVTALGSSPKHRSASPITSHWIASESIMHWMSLSRSSMNISTSFSERTLMST